MTKVVFYHKLNPNHRKHGDGSMATSKRRSLLQTPIPPQAGILYNGKRRRCRLCTTLLLVVRGVRRHCCRWHCFYLPNRCSATCCWTVPQWNWVLCAGNATRAYDVNTKLDITGLGIKVGVIDTGTSPAAVDWSQTPLLPSNASRRSMHASLAPVRRAVIRPLSSFEPALNRNDECDTTLYRC